MWCQVRLASAHNHFDSWDIVLHFSRFSSSDLAPDHSALTALQFLLLLADAKGLAEKQGRSGGKGRRGDGDGDGD